MDREDYKTDGLPQHQAPPPLAEFLAQGSVLERSPDGKSVFLYHGTNCYRRWEINRTGSIFPGRSGYSFFSNKPNDAFTHARAACLRDIGPRATNSLISEPVVLKVRFTERTWLQADFIQVLNSASPERDRSPDHSQNLSIAVLGPIPLSYIVEVQNCCHAGRDRVRSVRTFADGSFNKGIRRLKQKTGRFRLDAWLLRELGNCVQETSIWLNGGSSPELTEADELRRLSRVQLRA